MAERREVVLFVFNGVAGEGAWRARVRPTQTLRRHVLPVVLALALACGGSPKPTTVTTTPTTPIDQSTATALGGSLAQASTAVASASPQAALAAQAAMLALRSGVQATDVTIAASLLGGMPDRAALTAGTAKAFGFQLQVLHLAGSPSPLIFSGVLLFQGGADWILVAGPSPGAPIAPAVGVLSEGGLLWQANAGQESAQLQTQSGSCGIPLPAAVSSCERATFTGAGFNITSSTPVSSGATGSKTASMTTAALGSGVALIIDCSIGTLCPGSIPTANVYIGPSTVTLGPGGSQRFSATVVGTDVTNNAVTWSVEESAGGTIDASGLYTAPSAAGTFHVRATSVAAPTSYGLATVTVSIYSGIAVSVSPATSTTIVKGGIQFESSVTGTGDTAVTWSVEESAGGTITSQGAYTAPAGTGTFHVRATSVADPTSYGRATVTVTSSTVTVTAQPNTTDGLTNLACAASGAGPYTYAWHGYRDDGDTTGLSFSSLTAQDPTVTLTTTGMVDSNFYVFCVVSKGGSFAGSGFTLVTLTTGGTIPSVTVSPSTIHAGATDVTFDGTPTTSLQSVDKWIVQYGQYVVATTFEDYLKASPSSWSTVFTDSSPTGVMEHVSASKFAQPGSYRVQMTVTSSNDFSQVEGTFYFQVAP
jgi:hypothetical protein